MPLVLIELVDLELNGRVEPATTGRNKKTTGSQDPVAFFSYR
jgi:hypothetical protein